MKFHAPAVSVPDVAFAAGIWVPVVPVVTDHSENALAAVLALAGHHHQYPVSVHPAWVTANSVEKE